MPEFDTQNLHLVPYREATSLLHNGDLVLFRPMRWYSRLICRGTGGPWSHAALIRQNPGNGDPGTFDLLHMLEGGAQHIVPLEWAVAQWPNIMDVFRPDTVRFQLDLSKAVERMRQLCAEQYGARPLLRVAAERFAFIRLFINFETDDQADNKLPPFCSDAVSDAFAHAGQDPKLRTPHWRTTPNDLGTSLLFPNYILTLAP